MKADRKTLTILRACASAAIVGWAMVTSPAAAEALRMWTFLNPAGTSGREQALVKMISQFEAAHPGTTIQVEQQVWDQLTPKFMAAASANSAPDIIWLASDQINTVIQMGALGDLGSALSADDLADLNNVLVRAANVDGHQYAVGQSYNIAGMLARGAMLREATVDAAAIATWDDLDAAVEKLTVKDGGATARWGLCQQFAQTKADPAILLAHLLASGNQPFAEDGTAHWANDAGVKGIERAKALIDKGWSAPEAVSWNGEDMYDQFAAGRCAMATGSAVRVPAMQKATGDDDILFVPYPSYEAGKLSPQAMNAWMVGVWSGSANKDLAAQFVAHMASKDADVLWTTVGGTIPIRSSTATTLGDFFGQPRNAYLASAMNYIRGGGWVPPLAADTSGFREDMNRPFQQVLLNGLSPMEALVDAEKAYNTRHGHGGQ